MKSAWAIMVVAALGLLGTVASATQVSDYAVYSSGNVRVHSSVVMGDVASYNRNVVLKGHATVFGNAVAGSGIAVRRHSLVYGDATAGGGVKVKGHSRVKGTVTPNAPSATLNTLLPLPAAPTGPITAGGASYRGKLSNLDLTPGSYGNVRLKGVGRGGVLNLSAGDYYFKSLILKHTTVLMDLSGGPVNIYVQKGVRLRGTGVETTGLLPASLPDGSTGNSQVAAGRIYLEADGVVRMGGSDWLGTVVAPYAKLLLKNTSIIGALYGGKNIALKGRVSDVIYAPLLTDGVISPDPTDPDNPDKPLLPPQDFAGAPEPSTLALLAAGLMGLVGRTFSRRRRSA